LPLQFGHLKFKTDFAHDVQNVHSNVQITASLDSGGRSLLQHSQFGLSSNMMSSVQVVHNVAATGEHKRSLCESSRAAAMCAALLSV